MINLAYDDRGSGEPVVFIAGHGGAGRTWHPYQVPAFLAAGYRVITFDNRGIGATENAQGFTTETMVADTAALIEGLNAAPARIVGMSMGAFIAQELMLARPELVSAAVLMGTRGRMDRARQFFRDAEAELADGGVAPYTNRLSAYRSIATPVLVIGFSDDVLTPPYLGREVADALPNGRYVQIPDTGHLGFFERPDAVNAAMLKFFGEQH